MHGEISKTQFVSSTHEDTKTKTYTHFYIAAAKKLITFKFMI